MPNRLRTISLIPFSLRHIRYMILLDVALQRTLFFDTDLFSGCLRLCLLISTNVRGFSVPSLEAYCCVHLSPAAVARISVGCVSSCVAYRLAHRLFDTSLIKSHSCMKLKWMCVLFTCSLSSSCNMSSSRISVHFIRWCLLLCMQFMECAACLQAAYLCMKVNWWRLLLRMRSLEFQQHVFKSYTCA